MQNQKATATPAPASPSGADPNTGVESEEGEGEGKGKGMHERGQQRRQQLKRRGEAHQGAAAALETWTDVAEAI